MLRLLLGEKNVDWLTSLSDEIGRVKANPGQVRAGIMNLAVNARDAMPDRQIDCRNTALHFRRRNMRSP